MLFDYDKILNDLTERKFNTSDYKRILNEDKLIRDNYSVQDSKDFGNSKQYLDLRESSAVKYVIGAMLPVAKNYTQQIISNRNSIENTLRQMNDGIYRDANLDFDYQGSVTNNTHIRRNSDVDLLVICNYFITLQSGLPCPDPYRGNPKDDLLTLRNNCVGQLGKVSPKLNIDDSGAKSVKVSGGHLVVSVDVVPANWYETKESYITKSKNDKGIMVLDKKKMQRIANYPFKFNELLKEKDGKTAGVFKQAIRLLKNVKVDAENSMGSKIKFSSYGIASLLYDLSDNCYHIGYSPLMLVDVVYKQICRYVSDNALQELTDPLGESLNPNGHTVEGLRELQSAMQSLKKTLENEVGGLSRQIKIAV